VKFHLYRPQVNENGHEGAAKCTGPACAAAFVASPSSSPCRCKSKNNRASVTWDSHSASALGVPGDLHMDSTHLKYGAWCGSLGWRPRCSLPGKGGGWRRNNPLRVLLLATLACYCSSFPAPVGYRRRGLDAAQEFGDRFNLSKKSVTDTTFLTADDVFFGYSFGDRVDIGNKVQRFTTQDFGEYILFLRDGVKTAGIFYLVLTRKGNSR
jgi:hypothetical protein